MSATRKYTVTLDDDLSIARLIERATGMSTLSFTSVEALTAEISRRDPIGVFVDIHLGEKSGLDSIPALRRAWPCRPIIVMTADKSDTSITAALGAGADDFILKPLNPSEISARLQARLAQASSQTERQLVRIGNTVLDRKFRLLKTKLGSLYLSPIATHLLLTLSAQNETLTSKEHLKSEGWGETKVSDAALDRRISELRSALNEIGSSLEIVNEYGKGFALREASMKKNDSGSTVVSNLASTIGKNVLSEEKIRSLREISGGDDSLLIELSELFLAEYPKDFKSLSEASRNNQWDGVRAMAHKLEGMCMNLGLEALQECFARVLDGARNQDAKKVQQSILSASETFEKTLPFLHSWRKAA